MTLTKNAAQVRIAQSNVTQPVFDSVASLSKSRRLEESAGVNKGFRLWAEALGEANSHITVSQEEIDAAADEYKAVAQQLVAKLHWDTGNVTVIPQGSASTMTLIRSPDNSKFDIDAVCEVDISRVAAADPVGFFDRVGEGLAGLSPERKKRCWQIPCNGKSYYLEFTPSVPLKTVSRETQTAMALRFSPEPKYISTALAVVDNPTSAWKTSNPAGFTQWVEDTSKRQLITQLVMDGILVEKASRIESVPTQNVDISDTLRVAIRLFKRHRDMCVRRGLIDKEFQPISVILVTLLTSCYDGLADLNTTFNHPVELLAKLADLLPGMVAIRGGKYYVDNPTVGGENFAERWNEDRGARAEAFQTWCKKLRADLNTILASQDPADMYKKVRETFGTSAGSGPSGGGIGGGPYVITGTTNRPNRPSPAPKTDGLS